MHRFFSPSSCSLSYALLSCDVVTLCFRFHILAQSCRNCSSSIRVYSCSACIHKCQCAQHVYMHGYNVRPAIDRPRQLKCDEYTYLDKKHELTALHDYQPRTKALGNNYLCAPTVEMEDWGHFHIFSTKLNNIFTHFLP